MLDKKTLLIVAAIVLSTVVVTGGMFILAERFDRRFALESEIAELKAEKAGLEAIPDQALKTLHHERLLHFNGTPQQTHDRE